MIVPLLKMPLEKFETLTMLIPGASCPVTLPPLIAMPPLKLETFEIKIPGALPPSLPIVPPLFVMPPKKLETDVIKMPGPLPVIEPELTMLPLKVDTAPPPPIAIPVLELWMVPPLFVMPPPKLDVLLMLMAGPEAMMLLWESSVMPPAIVPVSTIWPVMVALVRLMPPGLIVPVLVMLPVKEVLVTLTQERLLLLVKPNGPV